MFNLIYTQTLSGPRSWENQRLPYLDQTFHKSKEPVNKFSFEKFGIRVNNVTQRNKIKRQKLLAPSRIEIV